MLKHILKTHRSHSAGFLCTLLIGRKWGDFLFWKIKTQSPKIKDLVVYLTNIS